MGARLAAQEITGKDGEPLVPDEPMDRMDRIELAKMRRCPGSVSR
ncbi:MAG: hypothetical protein V3R72_12830 [Gammaproteobacteria bacterium]